MLQAVCGLRSELASLEVFTKITIPPPYEHVPLQQAARTVCGYNDGYLPDSTPRSAPGATFPVDVSALVPTDVQPIF